MNLNRKQISKIALSIVVLGMMAGGFVSVAVADDGLGYATTSQRTYCVSFPPLRAGCPTATVTETVTDQAATTTVTVTTNQAVAPFYDVYVGQTVYYCQTWAQYQAAALAYGNVSAQPDADCHGVRN
jgi:hypothetical protein